MALDLTNFCASIRLGYQGSHPGKAKKMRCGFFALV
jgi:hypothetical protein